MKIYSWNVNGIRAVVKKGAFQQFVQEHQPDILCLQETKAQRGQAEIDMPDYEEYWNSAEKKGYSGTAIFTKVKPLQIRNDIPSEIAEDFDMVADTYGDPRTEGRVIAAQFNDFWLVTVYTPNAKDDLTRIPLRHKQWDPAFLAYCKALETGEYTPKTGETAGKSLSYGPAKPVIFCGDLNVAHTELDLANPKPNIGKKGFTDEERSGFQAFLDAGFVDTLRMFKQGNGLYTWWSHFAKSRERNVGWRIDYFLVSESLRSKVKAADIHPDVMGSDHCPVSINLVV